MATLFCFAAISLEDLMKLRELLVCACALSAATLAGWNTEPIIWAWDQAYSMIATVFDHTWGSLYRELGPMIYFILMIGGGITAIIMDKFILNPNPETRRPALKVIP